MRSYEHIIGKLAQNLKIPVEELRTLSEVQVASIWKTLEASRQKRITKEDARQRLTDNGFFDLPTMQKKLDRYVEQWKRKYLRDIVDLINAEQLKRGESIVTVAKEDDEPYPPARSN
jgi:hypothetical protein